MKHPSQCKLNSLFPINEVIGFINKKYTNYVKYHPSKLSEYKKILQENLSYPSVESNIQFKTIIETYTKGHKLKYLARLIKIVNKSIKNTNDVDMINHFVKYSDSDDKQHYELLRNKYNNNINNKTGGYMSQIDYIYNQLLHIFKKQKFKSFKISKIMDIGCGNGKKLEKLGKKFNVSAPNLICADIDEWFGYSAEQRNKQPFTPLKIEPNGPITYNNKVDLITMIHTIHHWCYDTSEKYIERFASLKDILNPGGYIVIIEHDIFASIDGCILDIEHGLYECVQKDACMEYTKKFSAQYLNFIEIEMAMERAGFEIILFEYYNAGSITTLVVPNKTYISVYKIKH